MKNMIVQKLMIGLVALCALVGLMVVSGCGPEKLAAVDICNHIIVSVVNASDARYTERISL